MQRGGWVYIMTNRRDGTLYLGVTSHLSRRVWEHREGLIDGFTRTYGLSASSGTSTTTTSASPSSARRP
jgi:predicted GIY-YIG superfamily endonuclease